MGIVSNTAKNMDIQILRKSLLPRLLGLYPEVELLDPRVIPC